MYMARLKGGSKLGGCCRQSKALYKDKAIRKGQALVEAYVSLPKTRVTYLLYRLIWHVQEKGTNGYRYRPLWVGDRWLRSAGTWRRAGPSCSRPAGWTPPQGGQKTWWWRAQLRQDCDWLYAESLFTVARCVANLIDKEDVKWKLLLLNILNYILALITIKYLSFLFLHLKLLH